MLAQYFFLPMLAITVCANCMAQTIDKKLTEHTPLVLTFLNVGLGSATLIQCPDNKTQVLIDAGDFSVNYTGASDMLHSELRKLMGSDNIIETAIVTHYHSDHAGGFIELLKRNEFHINNLLDNALTPTNNELQKELLNLITQKNITHTSITSTLPTFCPKSKLAQKLLPLDKIAQTELGCPDAVNDCSLKIILKYSTYTFILLSDATYKWVKFFKLDDSTILTHPIILQVPHHASQYSATYSLYDQLQPDYAIVSTGETGIGETDKLGYPSLSTINTLNEYFRNRFPENEIKNKTVLAYIKDPLTGITSKTQSSTHTRLSFTNRDGSISISAQ